MGFVSAHVKRAIRDNGEALLVDAIRALDAGEIISSSRYIDFVLQSIEPSFISKNEGFLNLGVSPAMVGLLETLFNLIPGSEAIQIIYKAVSAWPEGRDDRWIMERFFSKFLADNVAVNMTNDEIKKTNILRFCSTFDHAGKTTIKTTTWLCWRSINAFRWLKLWNRPHSRVDAFNLAIDCASMAIFQVDEIKWGARAALACYHAASMQNFSNIVQFSNWSTERMEDSRPLYIKLTDTLLQVFADFGSHIPATPTSCLI